MNTFMSRLKQETSYDFTTNGALAHKSTNSALYDLFALGGAYRHRSEGDIKFLFKKAFDENEVYALKCLFYLRDILNGAGERRFFRVAMKYLASYNPEAVKRNLVHIPEFGRWDDLYVFVGTPVEADAFNLMRKQLELDVQTQTPSLMAKWLKSENTSSAESRALASITRKYFGLTHRQYRKTLTILRKRINVLETLMSSNQWDKIDFDKIPSVAGMKYRKAFMRHDLDRKGKVTYTDFITDENTKVNAKTLFPYECVREALKARYKTDVERIAINKYWENMPDYLSGKPLNAICVCDTSGSMTWGAASARPIDVAIGLSMYCAERNQSPFGGYYISFASRPQLIPVEGLDFCDKVRRIYDTNLVDNTDITKVFELLKGIALKSKPEDIPESLIIISDMQIDQATGSWRYNQGYRSGWTEKTAATEMEQIRADWESHGLKCPKLIYWNVNAFKDTILDAGPDVTFVSGASATIFKQVVTGKTGYDLMMDVLNKEIYKDIG